MPSGEKKAIYFERLQNYLEEYSKIFIVKVDNVSSRQMQEIRTALRGVAVVLMGKNTMMRKVITGLVADGKVEYECLLQHITGNIGFVFTNNDFPGVRDILLSNKKDASARAGAIAPCDVFVSGGSSGMDPSKTSFFQALSIPTKITKGTIEIISDVHLIKTGDRVGPSEAALLTMLSMKPFTYGMTVEMIYEDGSCFSPEVLDLTDEIILEKFMAGVTRVASVSLAIGYPTLASVPHSLVNGLKKIMAVAVEADIDIPLAARAKAFLADPSAFAVAATPAASAAAPAAAAAPEKEESEDEDDGMDFGLFD